MLPSRTIQNLVDAPGSTRRTLCCGQCSRSSCRDIPRSRSNGSSTTACRTSPPTGSTPTSAPRAGRQRHDHRSNRAGHANAGRRHDEHPNQPVRSRYRRKDASRLNWPNSRACLRPAVPRRPSFPSTSSAGTSICAHGRLLQQHRPISGTESRRSWRRERQQHRKAATLRCPQDCSQEHRRDAITIRHPHSPSVNPAITLVKLTARQAFRRSPEYSAVANCDAAGFPYGNLPIG